MTGPPCPWRVLGAAGLLPDTLVGGRPGHFGEVDHSPDATGRDVLRRVPPQLAVPTQLASRHVDFENHYPSDPPPVAPDNVQGAASQTAWNGPLDLPHSSRWSLP